ncbi:(2Fe-2S)-binding protein [Georgenia sp. SUBG003]|uniref:(2Fe-2S)-binding protein n=1 Tax=Georgenia sp. SUBG003 TaxID=1497974 RepID=UPI003AB2E874
MLPSPSDPARNFSEGGLVPGVHHVVKGALRRTTSRTPSTSSTSGWERLLSPVVASAAAARLAAQWSVGRPWAVAGLSGRGGRPRGIFCGIGICHDCLVTVDGVPNQRACLVPLRSGMVLESGDGRG